MSKIKNGGLDQYGAEPFKQQQFGTAGVELIKKPRSGTNNNPVVKNVSYIMSKLFSL